jgi:hypothetical protein
MLQTVPAQAFDDIITELRRQPLQTNKYRDKAGTGKSQAFGVVGKRSLPPDYSRQCWMRPYLYKLLLDFGDKFVDISYNSITVNQGFKANPHKDKNNLGVSYLVGFGNYSGGELKIHEGDLSGNHCIQYKPIVTDFSKVLHSVEPFEGERFSLVYYWFQNKRTVPLPTSSVRQEGTKWFFYRGDEKITKEQGLPHPLRNRVKKLSIEEVAVEIKFS